MICLPHLLSSHQEEVHGSNVDADVVTEILEDLPDGGAGTQSDIWAWAIRKHHATLSGRTFPHSDWVAIIRLWMHDLKEVWGYALRVKYTCTEL